MRPALTRRVGALIVVLGLLGLLAAAAPVLAASITVNSLDDTAPADDGECTLREAITAANTDTASGAILGECAAGSGPDTISFGVAGTILLASASPVISSDISIDGAGAITVSGSSAHRVFDIVVGTVSLSGLAITGGSAAAGGGIFNNVGGTVSVANSTLSGNTAGDGGAVYNLGTLTIANSTISSNSASFDGGGILNAEGSLTVTDSTIAGNSALGDEIIGGGSGGGIRNAGGTGSVATSTISGNMARDGGGISNTGTLTVVNSAISENTASDGDGGGIDNPIGTLTVTGSTINENNAFVLGGGLFIDTGTVTVASSTISGNNATTSGGGLYNQAANLTVSNSTISGNLGILGAGGMYNHTGGILTVTNSTVSGNEGDIGGGIGNEGTVVATNVTISENTANLQAGGLYAQGTETLVNAIVAGNTTLIGPEINGPIEAETTNVIGVPPGLTLADILVPAGLADNGGPTETIALALVAGNPAIDTGTGAACAAAPVSGVDQRGLPRPAACDIGAYEAQPPTIAAHANVSSPATSAAGAAVSYTPPAGTDEQGGTATVACLPASGSTFPVGSTTVTCTATDAVGHIATGSFQVTVGLFSAAASPTATPRLLPNTASADGLTGVPGDFVSLGLIGLLLIGLRWRLGIPSPRGTVTVARGRRRG